MIFITIEDFCDKASKCHILTRSEELDCAIKMKTGDNEAREKLVHSYLPMVAGHIRHLKPHLQQLGLVLHCVQMLEREVDSFDFSQSGEAFSHHLSWGLRQTVAKYIVK